MSSTKEMTIATYLHKAIENSDLPFAKFLLEKFGVDVNLQDEIGYTALHYAVFSKNATMVDFLIENGADVNAKSNKGDTALHWAAYNLTNFAIIETLIKHGADIDAKDEDGKTALEILKGFRKNFEECQIPLDFFTEQQKIIDYLEKKYKINKL